MILDIVNLLLEGYIIVAFIASSLSLEAADSFLDVTLNHSQLSDCLLLSTLYLSTDLVVQLLVFNSHLIFELSDLLLEDLVGFLYLEVGDLRAKWLDLLADLFNKLASVCTF